MLLRVIHELHAQGIDFAVARATGETPRDTARLGLRKHVADDHIFLTVDDAVRALGPERDAGSAA
jgi:MFS superfamily sulfate permease-like transporter